jgi:hypothetical protein
MAFKRTDREKEGGWSDDWNKEDWDKEASKNTEEKLHSKRRDEERKRKLKETQAIHTSLEWMQNQEAQANLRTRDSPSPFGRRTDPMIECLEPESIQDLLGPETSGVGFGRGFQSTSLNSPHVPSRDILRQREGQNREETSPFPQQPAFSNYPDRTIERARNTDLPSSEETDDSNEEEYSLLFEKNATLDEKIETLTRKYEGMRTEFARRQRASTEMKERMISVRQLNEGVLKENEKLREELTKLRTENLQKDSDELIRMRAEKMLQETCSRSPVFIAPQIGAIKFFSQLVTENYHGWERDLVRMAELNNWNDDYCMKMYSLHLRGEAAELFATARKSKIERNKSKWDEKVTRYRQEKEEYDEKEERYKTALREYSTGRRGEMEEAVRRALLKTPPVKPRLPPLKYEEGWSNFKELLGDMRTIFGTSPRKELQTASAFNNARQHEDETVREFAGRIQKLYNRMYPAHSHRMHKEARNSILREKLVDGMLSALIPSTVSIDETKFEEIVDRLALCEQQLRRSRRRSQASPRDSVVFNKDFPPMAPLEPVFGRKPQQQRVYKAKPPQYPRMYQESRDDNWNQNNGYHSNMNDWTDWNRELSQLRSENKRKEAAILELQSKIRRIKEQSRNPSRTTDNPRRQNSNGKWREVEFIPTATNPPRKNQGSERTVPRYTSRPTVATVDVVQEDTEQYRTSTPQPIPLYPKTKMKPRSKQSTTCYHCGRKGHAAMDCRDKHRKPTTDSRTCYRCGKLGHLARTCQLQQQSQNPQPVGEIATEELETVTNLIEQVVRDEREAAIDYERSQTEKDGGGNEDSLFQCELITETDTELEEETDLPVLEDSAEESADYGEHKKYGLSVFSVSLKSEVTIPQTETDDERNYHRRDSASVRHMLEQRGKWPPHTHHGRPKSNIRRRYNETHAEFEQRRDKNRIRWEQQLREKEDETRKSREDSQQRSSHDHRSPSYHYGDHGTNRQSSREIRTGNGSIKDERRRREKRYQRKSHRHRKRCQQSSESDSDSDQSWEHADSQMSCHAVFTNDQDGTALGTGTEGNNAGPSYSMNSMKTLCNDSKGNKEKMDLENEAEINALWKDLPSAILADPLQQESFRQRYQAYRDICTESRPDVQREILLDYQFAGHPQHEYKVTDDANGLAHLLTPTARRDECLQQARTNSLIQKAEFNGTQLPCFMVLPFTAPPKTRFSGCFIHHLEDGQALSDNCKDGMYHMVCRRKFGRGTANFGMNLPGTPYCGNCNTNYCPACAHVARTCGCAEPQIEIRAGRGAIAPRSSGPSGSGGGLTNYPAGSSALLTGASSKRGLANWPVTGSGLTTGGPSSRGRGSTSSMAHEDNLVHTAKGKARAVRKGLTGAFNRFDPIRRTIGTTDRGRGRGSTGIAPTGRGRRSAGTTGRPATIPIESIFPEVYPNVRQDRNQSHLDPGVVTELVGSGRGTTEIPFTGTQGPAIALHDWRPNRDPHYMRNAERPSIHIMTNAYRRARIGMDDWPLYDKMIKDNMELVIPLSNSSAQLTTPQNSHRKAFQAHCLEFPHKALTNPAVDFSRQGDEDLSPAPILGVSEEDRWYFLEWLMKHYKEQVKHLLMPDDDSSFLPFDRNLREQIFRWYNLFPSQRPRGWTVMSIHGRQKATSDPHHTEPSLGQLIPYYLLDFDNNPIKHGPKAPRNRPKVTGIDPPMKVLQTMISFSSTSAPSEDTSSSLAETPSPDWIQRIHAKGKSSTKPSTSTPKDTSGDKKKKDSSRRAEDDGLTVEYTREMMLKLSPMARPRAEANLSPIARITARGRGDQKRRTKSVGRNRDVEDRDILRRFVGNQSLQEGDRLLIPRTSPTDVGFIEGAFEELVPPSGGVDQSSRYVNVPSQFFTHPTMPTWTISQDPQDPQETSQFSGNIVEGEDYSDTEEPRQEHFTADSGDSDSNIEYNFDELPLSPAAYQLPVWHPLWSESEERMISESPKSKSPARGANNPRAAKSQEGSLFQDKDVSTSSSEDDSRTNPPGKLAQPLRIIKETKKGKALHRSPAKLDFSLISLISLLLIFLLSCGATGVGARHAMICPDASQALYWKLPRAYDCSSEENRFQELSNSYGRKGSITVFHKNHIWKESKAKICRKLQIIRRTGKIVTIKPLTVLPAECAAMQKKLTCNTKQGETKMIGLGGNTYVSETIFKIPEIKNCQKDCNYNASTEHCLVHDLTVFLTFEQMFHSLLQTTTGVCQTETECQEIYEKGKLDLPDNSLLVWNKEHRTKCEFTKVQKVFGRILQNQLTGQSYFVSEGQDLALSWSTKTNRTPNEFIQKECDAVEKFQTDQGIYISVESVANRQRRFAPLTAEATNQSKIEFFNEFCKEHQTHELGEPILESCERLDDGTKLILYNLIQHASDELINNGQLLGKSRDHLSATSFAFATMLRKTWKNPFKVDWSIACQQQENRDRIIRNSLRADATSEMRRILGFDHLTAKLFRDIVILAPCHMIPTGNINLRKITSDNACGDKLPVTYISEVERHMLRPILMYLETETNKLITEKQADCGHFRYQSINPVFFNAENQLFGVNGVSTLKTINENEKLPSQKEMINYLFPKAEFQNLLRKPFIFLPFLEIFFELKPEVLETTVTDNLRVQVQIMSESKKREVEGRPKTSIDYRELQVRQNLDAYATSVVNHGTFGFLDGQEHSGVQLWIFITCVYVVFVMLYVHCAPHSSGWLRYVSIFWLVSYIWKLAVIGLFALLARCRIYYEYDPDAWYGITLPWHVCFRADRLRAQRLQRIRRHVVYTDRGDDTNFISIREDSAMRDRVQPISAPHLARINYQRPNRQSFDVSTPQCPSEKQIGRNPQFGDKLNSTGSYATTSFNEQTGRSATLSSNADQARPMYHPSATNLVNECLPGQEIFREIDKGNRTESMKRLQKVRFNEQELLQQQWERNEEDKRQDQLRQQWEINNLKKNTDPMNPWNPKYQDLPERRFEEIDLNDSQESSQAQSRLRPVGRKAGMTSGNTPPMAAFQEAVPIIEIEINGEKVTALIDTGSVMSYIGQDTAKRVKASIASSVFATANTIADRPLRIVGETCVLLCIKRTAFLRSRFLVTEQDIYEKLSDKHYHCILGTDFINQLGEAFTFNFRERWVDTFTLGQIPFITRQLNPNCTLDVRHSYPVYSATPARIQSEWRRDTEAAKMTRIDRPRPDLAQTVQGRICYPNSRTSVRSKVLTDMTNSVPESQTMTRYEPFPTADNVTTTFQRYPRGQFLEIPTTSIEFRAQTYIPEYRQRRTNLRPIKMYTVNKPSMDQTNKLEITVGIEVMQRDEEIQFEKDTLLGYLTLMDRRTSTEETTADITSTPAPPLATMPMYGQKEEDPNRRVGQLQSHLGNIFGQQNQQREEKEAKSKLIPEKINYANKNRDSQVRKRRIVETVVKALDKKFLAQLTFPEFESFRRIIGRWSHQFSESLLEIQQTDKIKCDIELFNKVPFAEKAFRIPHSMIEQVEAEIVQMLKVGVIERTCSPYNSTTVIVKKKGGGVRICLNAKNINRRCHLQRFPIRNIQDILNGLGGAKYFTTLDIRQAYWHVPLAEDSKPVTAFEILNKQYRYTVMCYGLKSAPAIFSDLMDRMVTGCEAFATNYLDDVLIFSRTFVEHLRHLECVFQRLEEYKLSLNPEKCLFFRKNLLYLGFIITPDGIKPDPMKITAIQGLHPPTDVSTLRSFLGLVNFYKKFVKDFSKICVPLTHLLHKNVEYKWTEECQASFDMLKQALVSEPILAYPQWDKGFILYTDSSGYQFGGILSQVHEDGEEHVISYASRTMTEGERKWSITEKELAALVFSVKAFQHYTYGNPVRIVTDHKALTFLLTSQHIKLKLQRWILLLQDMDITIEYRAGKLHGNADALSRLKTDGEHPPVDPDPEHALGIYAVTRQQSQKEDTQTAEDPNIETDITDGMEEVEVDIPQEGNDEDEDRVEQDVPLAQGTAVNSQTEGRSQRAAGTRGTPHTEMARQFHLRQTGPEVISDDDFTDLNDLIAEDPKMGALLDYLQTGDVPIGSPEAQREGRNIIKMARNYTLINDRLHRIVTDRRGNMKPILVVPYIMRSRIIEQCHDHALAGHQGITKTVMRILDVAWWPRMSKTVADYIARCGKCATRKPPPRPHRAPLQPVPLPNRRFRVWHTDCLGPFPVDEETGNIQLVVFTETMTRWTEAVAVKTIDKVTVARAFVEHIVCRFGVPVTVVSDQGPCYDSEVWDEICTLLGIRIQYSSVYHPQGNAIVERQNKSILDVMCHYVNVNGDNWVNKLPFVLFTINTSISESLKESPFFLMYCTDPRMPIKAVLDAPKREYMEIDDLKSQIKLSSKDALESAQKYMKIAQEKQKYYYDKKATNHTYQTGDLVYCKTNRRAVGGPKKFFHRYFGPFRVTDTYSNKVLLNKTNDPFSAPQWTHIDRVKLCLEPQTPQYRHPTEPILFPQRPRARFAEKRRQELTETRTIFQQGEDQRKTQQETEVEKNGNSNTDNHGEQEKEAETNGNSNEETIPVQEDDADLEETQAPMTSEPTGTRPQAAGHREPRSILSRRIEDNLAYRRPVHIAPPQASMQHRWHTRAQPK